MFEAILMVLLVPSDASFVQKKQAKMPPGMVVISVGKAPVETSGWVPKEAIVVDSDLNVFLKNDAKLKPFPGEAACIFARNTQDGWEIDLFSPYEWEVTERVGGNVVVIVDVQLKFLGIQPKAKLKEKDL